ncbi:23S rRNA (uracil(1939)-C(5))-methyltransferase RlmD [Candidatus Stoquefichus massiliensis]|uniref:23S rRNA (uracil(1939)-C(5))-methyltransferase RlmD n=1 Tax=Candidatus Stoquefichus massiliensis TaxID=1470350 RepID=UPI0004848A3A|nr:23S rRNA (uracil(1939)-C(5))-methyltransferase RlmD [Candidatus Stoquefichus massiliensis]
MRKEEVEIKKLGINGEGIGYINKKICFVENAMPEEIVEVEIIAENPKFLKGRVLQYLQKSKDRVETICQEDRHCQGCSLTSLAYAKHLPYKKGVLKDALKKYTNFDVDKLPIKATYPSPVEKGYRHVVSLPLTYFKGKVHAGIYQRETKYLTLMNGCGMQDPLINECLVEIENIINKHKARDYNDKIKKGLRFIRLKNIDGKIQILFVTGEDGLKQEIINDLSQIDAIKSIWFTINTTRHQEFELQGYKKVYGLSTLPFQYANQQYLYSVKSDFPVNPVMEKVKLDMIRSFIPEDALVLSLNCGIGLLELSMNNEIVVIDEKNYHIKDAKENAKFLHKDNVEFLCKNINEGTISQCKKKSFDYIIVRSEELSPAMKQSFVLSKSKNVIYVSDHPSSLAKDIEELSQYFKVESIIPLDTYPYTAKMETIVKLKRK